MIPLNLQMIPQNLRSFFGLGPVRLNHLTRPVPQGRNNLAQRFQRWVGIRKGERSPGGTAELSQYIGWIVGNAVFLQQFQEFFLKASPLMMRRLILDISDHVAGLRCTRAERAVAFLPGEIRSILVQPF
jgi:hypothetical protein